MNNPANSDTGLPTGTSLENTASNSTPPVSTPVAGMPAAGTASGSAAAGNSTEVAPNKSRKGPSPLAPVMVDIKNVTKTFGAKTAVNDLTLEVRQGELFAFLGPNGAGKTTTIKMMCGLLFPNTGSIRMAGFDLKSQGDQARQQLSYVPDQPYLYEKLTGREVLRFIADMYKMPADHSGQRIEAVIEEFGLGPFVDDLTESYSHGMRQRTVFASALLHEPQVLITDEPTVGLDPRSIRMLKDLLRREADRGMTIFLSTHSLDIAHQLADRIGVVGHGKLICVGTFDELKHKAALDGSLEDVFLKLTEEGTPQSV